MEDEKFDVLIVHDSEIIQKNITKIIESIDCMRIVGIANCYDGAIKMIEKLTPRCIVIDKIKTKSENFEFLESIEKHASLVIVDIDKLLEFL